ncbi:hypothetical protein L914_21225 [Phytophthora nicotianae]|nr:hypothetical protein L914_21225 [Phytophthora nicotianae]
MKMSVAYSASVGHADTQRGKVALGAASEATTSVLVRIRTEDGASACGRSRNPNLAVGPLSSERQHHALSRRANELWSKTQLRGHRTARGPTEHRALSTGELFEY